MKVFTQYIGKRWGHRNGIFAGGLGGAVRAAVLAGVLGTGLLGCSPPDPRQPRGAMAAAAEAIERGEGRSLFRLIDQRSRHALAAIRDARAQAYALVQADYPEPEKTQALQALGDAATATDAADLFVMRCPEACQKQLAQSLVAPTAERKLEGGDLEVTTAAGTRIQLHLGNDGRYGLAFHNAELSAERDRASRELEQIRTNAEVYRRRRSLASSPAGAAPAPGSDSDSGSGGTTPSRK